MTKDGYNRNSKARPIGEAMKDLLKDYNLKQRYDQNLLIGSWEKLMGKLIANRTGKLFFKKNTLYVEIQSAPLKSELILAKSKIIENLKRDVDVGVVDDIVFL